MNEGITRFAPSAALVADHAERATLLAGYLGLASVASDISPERLREQLAAAFPGGRLPLPTVLDPSPDRLGWPRG